MRIRILHGRLRDRLPVVTQSDVRSERRHDLPLILHKQAGLFQIRMRERSGRAGAGKRFGKSHRILVGKVCKARENVRPEKVAREVVEDVVVVVVEAALQCVIAKNVCRGVGDLITLDRRLARRKRIPSDVDHRNAALRNLRFGIGAVRLPWLAIFQILRAHLVEER